MKRRQGMKQKELSSAVYYILSQFISAVASFVLLALFSRKLSTENYGDYSLYTAIFTIVVVFIGWNTHMSIVRRKYEKEENLEQYINSLVGFQLISISLMSLISLVLFKWTIISMSIVTAGLLSLSYIYFEYVRAIGDAKKFFILNLFRQVGVMVITIYLLYTDRGYTSGVYSNILVLTLINIYYFIKLRVKIKVNKEDIKYSLMFSIPLIPFALGNVLLSYVDRFVVYGGLGAEETGKVSFMTNYSNLFILIIQAITLGWQPRVFGLIQEDKKIEIESYAKCIFTFLTFVAMGMIFFSKEFTLIIGSKSYADTYRYMTPLIVGNLFYFIYIFYTDFTIYYKKNNHLTVYVFLAVILKIILSLIIVNTLPFQYITYITLIIFFVLMWLQYNHAKQSIHLIPNVMIFMRYFIVFSISLIGYEGLQQITLSTGMQFIARIIMMLFFTGILGLVLVLDLKKNK